VGDSVSVGHLPGGAALDEMLRKVTGSPGSIDTIASQWRTSSGDVQEFGGALASAVQNVADAWNGRSAEAFDSYMREYGTAAESLKSALSDCAASLGEAASALRESHTEISSICRDLNTNAANYRTRYLADHPDATEADMRSGLSALVERAKKDAKPWVDSAEAAVSKAKQDIDRHLRDRKLTFRAIPDVTKQEFVAEKGPNLDWVADPDYRPDGGVSVQGGRGAPVTTAGHSGGFSGYGPSGPPPPGGGAAPPERVREWIEEAVRILAARGVPTSKMNVNDIWLIIQHESGGNPHAINNWDSNAARGTPSKGLMQTIDPTFNAYALDGHRNIYDPVDNIIAGVRYAIARYGSVSNVPGVVNTKNGLGYVGY
jgi:WXG100 family type VII secretion target